jgi:hypothetical protein
LSTSAIASYTSSPVTAEAPPSMPFSAAGLIAPLNPRSLRPHRSDEGGPGDLRDRRFQDSQPRPLNGPAQHNAEQAENQRSSIGHASRFRTGCQMTAMRYGLRVEASHNFPGEGCA